MGVPGGDHVGGWSLISNARRTGCCIPVVVARMSEILILSGRKACVERYGEDKDKSRGFEETARLLARYGVYEKFYLKHASKPAFWIQRCYSAGVLAVEHDWVGSSIASVSPPAGIISLCNSETDSSLVMQVPIRCSTRRNPASCPAPELN